MRWRRHVVVMARAPRLGMAKRRLAAQAGGSEAIRFHRANAAAVLARLGRDPRWHCSLAATPTDFRPPHGWPRLPRFDQGRGDIGERMLHALGRHQSGRVVVVGSDVPGIAPVHIARAFRALAAADAVFGPAEDGGFWLVGAGAGSLPALRRAFGKVDWSAPDTLRQTLSGLDARLHVTLVDELWDVDDRTGWLRWRQRGSLRAICSPSSGA